MELGPVAALTLHAFSPPAAVAVGCHSRIATLSRKRFMDCKCRCRSIQILAMVFQHAELQLKGFADLSWEYVRCGPLKPPFSAVLLYEEGALGDCWLANVSTRSFP